MPKKYWNTNQSYTAQCGAGFTGEYTAAVPAGTYSDRTLLLANNKAFAEAKRRAQAGLICKPVTEPTPDVTWYWWANENQTVTVPANTKVRYGASGKFVEKIMSGTF